MTNIVEIEPVLLRMRRNDPELIVLRLYTDSGGSRFHWKNIHSHHQCGAFPRRLSHHSSSWGEVGKEIGKNKHLHKIVVGGLRVVNSISSAREHKQLELFCKGINTNRSIADFTILNCHFINDGSMLQVLEPFFEKNHRLSSLGIRRCNLGSAGICSLSASLIHARFIKKIDLSNNNIDGDSIRELVKALYLNHDLEELNLAGNSIGGESNAGCLALAALLQKEQSTLKRLNLRRNDINDSGAVILAESIKENRSLTHLGLGGNIAITSAGWNALSKVVCNPSSIAATYFCNHTLSVVTCGRLYYPLPRHSLELNKLPNKIQVARQKIFQHHFQRENFRIEPFIDMEVSQLIHVVKFIDIAHAEIADYRMRNEHARYSILFLLLKNIPQIFGGNGNRTHPKLR